MSAPRATAVLAALLALGHRALGGVSAGVDLRYENDRVTAHLRSVPVADALAALAGASGAELRGTVVAPRAVTLDLDAVPVDEALHRVLGVQNFTVRYGEDGRLKAIVLRGGPEVPSPRTDRSPAAGVPVAEMKPGFPIALSRIFEHHRPIEVPDPLATRLGAKKVGMPALLQTATSDEDGLMRVLASNVVLGALEHESRYRRSFLRSLHRLDPDELSTIASGPSGARFQELLEFFAAHSREPALQKKAGVVLDQVREARGGGSGG